LQCELPISEKTSKKFKIKLICFNYIVDIKDLILASGSKDVYIISKNNNNYEHQKNYSEERSKMIYKINKRDDKMKIFGGNFVKNNKDKCIII